MILYKALIVLTVIFDIACCLTFFNEFMERRECTKILKKVGFSDNYFFYNVNFLLQFENQEEFIKHINTKIKIKNQTQVSSPKKFLKGIFRFKDQSTSESPGDKDSDIPTDNNEPLPECYSYLIEFYSQISRRNKYFLKQAIPTPEEYCTSKVLEKYTLSPEECITAMRKGENVLDLILEPLLKSFVSGKEPDGEDANVQVDDVDKKNEILNCKNSILDFEFKNDGVVYKYDENNRYRNVLMSIMIDAHFAPREMMQVLTTIKSAPYSPREVTQLLTTMKTDVRGYYYYHSRLTSVAIKFQLFYMYSPKELCGSYFSKKKDEMKKKREKNRK